MKFVHDLNSPAERCGVTEGTISKAITLKALPSKHKC